MFGKLFSRIRKSTKTILLVDVESGSVSAALGKLNSKGVPTLLYTTRQELPLRLTRSGEEMATETLKAITAVTDDVRKKAALWTENERVVPQKIEHVACFLASPWSTTTIRSVRFARAKPFVMTTELLRRMISDESRAAEVQMHEEMQVLERAALSLSLNGYRTDTISSTSVTSAEVALVSTLASKHLHTELERALGEYPGDPVKTFHSFVLPASYALTQIGRAENALLLMVGAEVTEALLIKNGSPAGTMTFPVGSHVLLRTLKSHAGMGRQESETALKLASLEGTRLSAEVRASLVDAAKNWSNSLQEALAPLANSGIPYTAYLFANPIATPWFTDSLTQPLSRIGHTAPMDVTAFTQELFASAFKITAGSAFDAALTTELIFADTRFDEGATLSLLSTREPLLKSSRGRIQVSTEASSG